MIVDTSIITVHGAERMKERCNLKSQKNIAKSIELAIQRGKRAEDLSSWERNFIEKDNRNDCTAIAYNGYCYIIGPNNVCITIYALPTWFGKKKLFNGKERIRNIRKYSKLNNAYENCIA